MVVTKFLQRRVNVWAEFDYIPPNPALRQYIDDFANYPISEETKMSAEHKVCEDNIVLDPEFEAMDICVKQLMSLTPEARTRVLNYLLERFKSDRDMAKEQAMQQLMISLSGTK
jgi:hypothetical protein